MKAKENQYYQKFFGFSIDSFLSAWYINQVANERSNNMNLEN